MKITGIFMGVVMASTVAMGAAQATLPPPPGSVPARAGLDYSDVHKVSETDIVGVVAQDLYDALDVRPMRNIAVKIAMHSTKSAGLLNCTKTSYYQKGISYSCTYAETDDVHMKLNSYRDIYNALNITSQQIYAPEKIWPPFTRMEKAVGSLSCDKTTHPSQMAPTYNCRMK